VPWITTKPVVATVANLQARFRWTSVRYFKCNCMRTSLLTLPSAYTVSVAIFCRLPLPAGIVTTRLINLAPKSAFWIWIVSKSPTRHCFIRELWLRDRDLNPTYLGQNQAFYR
jgi:hypothetical protein